MADATDGKPGRMTVETEIQHDDTVSADIGTSGSNGSTAKTFNSDAQSYEFTEADRKKPEGEAGDTPDAGDSVLDGSDADTDGAPPEDTTEGAEDADLGEWKAGDAEVVSKFEARYFNKEDGTLKKDALSKEFFANRAKDPKAGLNESTYQFLKDTLGITKEFAQEVEAALVAQTEQTTAKFFTKFGGKDRYEQAVKWGKEGGYTPAQRARFNAALAKGGEEFEDAVEALMARYSKQNPQRQQQGQRRGPPRRSSPQRTTTGGDSYAQPGGGGDRGGDRFENAAAHQKAWTEALGNERSAKTPQEKRAARDAKDAIFQKARRGYIKPNNS